jgi:hypothetical protein
LINYFHRARKFECSYYCGTQIENIWTIKVSYIVLSKYNYRRLFPLLGAIKTVSKNDENRNRENRTFRHYKKYLLILVILLYRFCCWLWAER